MWVSPLSSRKPKPLSSTPEVFKVEKPTLPKAEAKKILHHSGDLSLSQVLWTQRWLEQKICERSLPPQFARADAFGQIAMFLSPPSALSLLNEIRADFQKIVPLEEKSDFDFLLSLANEAYHEHLPPPQTSSRNSRLQDDGHVSD
jgi:hypothetical protein